MGAEEESCRWAQVPLPCHPPLPPQPPQRFDRHVKPLGGRHVGGAGESDLAGELGRGGIDIEPCQ